MISIVLINKVLYVRRPDATQQKYKCSDSNMRIQMEEENKCKFRSTRFHLCRVASHGLRYYFAAGGGRIVYGVETGANEWNVSCSKIFRICSSDTYDVAVKLNRRALTRTIFVRTTGTSYLKFNLDIIAYRRFLFFIPSLACGSELMFPSPLYSTSTTTRTNYVYACLWRCLVHCFCLRQLLFCNR